MNSLGSYTQKFFIKINKRISYGVFHYMDGTGFISHFAPKGSFRHTQPFRLPDAPEAVQVLRVTNTKMAGLPAGLIFVFVTLPGVEPGSPP